MREWKKLPGKTQRFGVLLFNDFSVHCLANLVEPLRAANMLSAQTLYEWQHLSLDGRPVVSSSGLEIRPEAPLEFSQGDYLAVLPSYGHRRFDNVTVSRMLRAAASRFSVVMGLDTGAWLLAASGLLDGRRATIHWDEMQAFAERFPEVLVDPARHIIDGDRITCSGAMTTFDLMMDLIADHCGEALRQDVAALFLSREEMRMARLPDRLVARAVAMMRDHLEEPLSIPELSRKLGVSQKTLETRTRATLGATPAQVYRREKLLFARRLVRESALGIAEIALRCGYQNAAAMTRAFREEFGATPRDMRSS